MSVKSTSKKTPRVGVRTVISGPRRTRRTGNRDGRAFGTQRLRRGRPDLVEGDRLEQPGKAPIVIETEPNCSQPCRNAGDAVVGFEQPRDRSDQILRAFLQLSSRSDPSLAKLANFRIDRLDRAVDVLGIDAGANHERPFPNLTDRRS